MTHVQEYESLGRDRLNQFRQVQAAPPESFFAELASLPWIRFREVIDHELDARGAFAPSLLELVVLLEELAINQRGPGILGYFTQLELSFSMRADASYAPHSRVVSLSLGFPLLANELEATYRWLESVFFRESGMIPLDDLARMQAPLEVRDELAAFYRTGAEGLPISGKSGVGHPIGQALLRFVLAHELGHMIDFAQSPQLRASWRETVWSHYQDALDYCLSTGAIDRSRYTRFLRSSLDTPVADQWAIEFLADGLGFYTLSQLPPPSGMTWGRSYAVLQAAVEMFFRVLVLVYRRDLGTATHPPPTLRSYVICAGRRSERRASWSQFLSESWGAGVATSHLLGTTMRTMGGIQ